MPTKIVLFKQTTVKSVRRYSVAGTDNQILKLRPGPKAIKYYVEPSKVLRNVPPASMSGSLRLTGQIIWALVDGAGQDQINLQIAGSSDVFDLLA